MEPDLKSGRDRNTKSSQPVSPLPPSQIPAEATQQHVSKSKVKTREKNGGTDADGNAETNTTTKRRCVSTACIACRKRKSKCDGQLPKCAACASVYLTQCQYAPHTDHRRKGVYKKDMDGSKTRNSTLHTLVHAILNSEEDSVPDLVHQIRTCENLEHLADAITSRTNGTDEQEEPPDSPVYPSALPQQVPRFESELSGKMGDLRLEGSVKFIGGTSNLIWLLNDSEIDDAVENSTQAGSTQTSDDPILSWTSVTRDREVILHLIQMYFSWHYPYFTTLSKELFYRDFYKGSSTQHCSSLLVNAMLCLGCHFTAWPAARDKPDDTATNGDHFFREAKRLMHENDEFVNAKLCTVQALALMSVREAGCGREGKGWLYSGMSFRMAMDLGLDVDAPRLSPDSPLSDEDVDARRITFWGCFLFDKCWSNYLGRPPQLALSSVSVPKPDIFPSEDGGIWSPYTDSGVLQVHMQPARTRTVARYISQLSEISSDLVMAFYHPTQLDKQPSKQAELKKLCALHTRLEAWKKNLPQELEPRDGQLPQILLMHMFFQLLFIHIYRPFLKYNRATSPLPAHVSPRKFCTQAAAAISKLLRLYKRTYGLRHICNIAVYIAHSACTIHLLNLPDKKAKQDIVHGVRHLEEIGEMWTCARRTLRILAIMSDKWEAEVPDEAIAVFSRTRARWGTADLDPPPSPSDHASPPSVTHRPHKFSQSSVGPRVLLGHSNSAAIPYLQDSFSVPTSSTKIESSQNGFPPVDKSTPLHAEMQAGRNSSRLLQTTELTKAQQDAWNAHQARFQASNSPTVASSSAASRAADPAVLFGGVESLVEDNQNWWIKDQAALAAGISNWMDPGPTTVPSTSHADWPTDFTVPTTAEQAQGTMYDYAMHDYLGYGDQSGHGKFQGTMTAHYQT